MQRLEQTLVKTRENPAKSKPEPLGTDLAQELSPGQTKHMLPVKVVQGAISGWHCGMGNREPDVVKEFCGDPPLPVARLTPATGHRVFFWR